MAYKITDKCISCGACAGACPVTCISQGDERYVIDPEQCISCGTWRVFLFALVWFVLFKITRPKYIEYYIILV